MSPVKLLGLYLAGIAGGVAVGTVTIHYADSTAAEAVAPPVGETVQERVFVCTDKYGTSQERFGVSSYDRADQVWAITFADGQVGHYLQMHGEWCYVLPVEIKEEEK